MYFLKGFVRYNTVHLIPPSISFQYHFEKCVCFTHSFCLILWIETETLWQLTLLNKCSSFNIPTSSLYCVNLQAHNITYFACQGSHCALATYYVILELSAMRTRTLRSLIIPFPVLTDILLTTLSFYLFQINECSILLAGGIGV